MAGDPFNLASGLPDNFHGAITDPIFRFDDKIVDDATGDPILQLDLTIVPVDDESLEPQHKLYSCGPGWEPADGGKSAVREDDPDNEDANFNGNTKIGRLIGAMVKTEAAEIIKARYESGTGTRDAAMFDGLVFNWVNETRDYSFTKDGKEIKGQSNLLLPTEFVEEQGAKKGRTKKQGAKKAAAKTKAKAKAESNGSLSPDQLTQIKAIFDAAEEFDEWLGKVVDEVEGVDEHMGYVADTGDAGLWSDLVEERV